MKYLFFSAATMAVVLSCSRESDDNINSLPNNEIPITTKPLLLSVKRDGNIIAEYKYDNKGKVIFHTKNGINARYVYDNETLNRIEYSETDNKIYQQDIFYYSDGKLSKIEHKATGETISSWDTFSYNNDNTLKTWETSSGIKEVYNYVNNTLHSSDLFYNGYKRNEILYTVDDNINIGKYISPIANYKEYQYNIISEDITYLNPFPPFRVPEKRDKKYTYNKNGYPIKMEYYSKTIRNNEEVINTHVEEYTWSK